MAASVPGKSFLHSSRTEYNSMPTGIFFLARAPDSMVLQPATPREAPAVPRAESSMNRRRRSVFCVFIFNYAGVHALACLSPHSTANKPKLGLQLKSLSAAQIRQMPWFPIFHADQAVCLVVIGNFLRLAVPD